MRHGFEEKEKEYDQEGQGGHATGLSPKTLKAPSRMERQMEQTKRILYLGIHQTNPEKPPRKKSSRGKGHP